MVVMGTLQNGALGTPEEDTVPYTLPTDGTALLNHSPLTSYPQVAEVQITAYSSRVEETDDTPFITASGTLVRSGVVAANWLPFGTKVRIPDLFGDTTFTVEDRMHWRNSDRLDVWFPTTEEAVRFGTQTARVEIL